MSKKWALAIRVFLSCVILPVLYVGFRNQDWLDVLFLIALMALPFFIFCLVLHDDSVRVSGRGDHKISDPDFEAGCYTGEDLPPDSKP